MSCLMMTNLTTNENYDPERVLSALCRAGSALLLCHVSPDGDTLGSALALAERLRRMGKTVQVAVDGEIHRKYLCLKGAGEILKRGEAPKPFDTAVAIDISDEKRIGCYAGLFFGAENTVLIDHHETNPGFAQSNMIDGGAGSTGVVLYRLFPRLGGLALSLEEAVCLYAAISTDTGNFLYSSTGEESFSVMVDLLRAGLPLEEYGRIFHREKEYEFLDLLDLARKTLRVTADGQIAGMRVTLQDLEQAHANDTHRDGIVDYAIDLVGVKYAYLASELKDGRTKFSLRTLPGRDVAALAKSLGGGGHGQAAGVSLNLPMDQAVALIEKGLLAELEGYKDAK